MLKTTGCEQIRFKYVDALQQNESRVAGHAQISKRDTPEERAENYILDSIKLTNHIHNGRGIIILDDVIYTGSHYKAAEQTVRESFPSVRIFGLFVARVARPEIDVDWSEFFSVDFGKAGSKSKFSN